MPSLCLVVKLTYNQESRFFLKTFWGPYIAISNASTITEFLMKSWFSQQCIEAQLLKACFLLDDQSKGRDGSLCDRVNGISCRGSHAQIPGNQAFHFYTQGGGRYTAQGKQSYFPPSSSGFESWLRLDFFSILLSWWTVLRSNSSSAMQWISQMQLAVTFRA